MTSILKATLALVAAIGAILLASSQISAQETALNITSATQVPGGEASIELTALSMPAPGLGAWTIDITYDPAVVTAVACTPEPVGPNVCNASFSESTALVAGANGDGLQGDTLLASIVFECGNSEGVSDLTLSIRTLADATVGDPQLIAATLQHGSITCAAEEPPPSTPATATPTPDAGILPDSGTGGDFDGGGSLNWLIAALAAAGLVAVAGAGTLRWRAAAASSDFAAGPASETTGAPNAGTADSGRQGVPSWLAAALAGAGLLAGFYALRQRKR